MVKIKSITQKQGLKFTEAQLRDLQHEDAIWEKCSHDDEGEYVKDWYQNPGKKLYSVVEKEDKYIDMEKSYKEIQYTILEIDTGKYYQGDLTYSHHWDDDGTNQRWKEVKKVTKTITITK